MAQSVIDELENLDLDGTVKKKSSEDDDFDYVYHLPHADLSRLPPRKYDPFAQFAIVEPEKESKQLKISHGRANVPTIAAAVGSLTSLQGKQAAKLLSLGADAAPADSKTKRLHNHHKSSKEKLAAGGGHLGLGSQLHLGSNANSKMDLVPGGMGRRVSHSPSFMTSDSHVASRPESVHGSYVQRRSNAKKVSPFNESVSSSVDFTRPDYNSRKSLAAEGLSYFGSTEGSPSQYTDEDDLDFGPPTFKAVPVWITKYVSSKIVAIICFTIITTLTLVVIIYDFVMLGLGQDVVDT
ncbi:hypothetical protein HK100_001798 [Physocladia obscura]|uniref:Uncharacterized protein n=1 Tax=Physocladia obscura TaxID=109957 RepID=A0AAD5TAL0_9FUNG|nr:hypothetical protein HK100_001798 [Physocladia obscura]